jgi:UDP-glucose 4-epimerase
VRVLVTGGSGFIGSHVVEALVERGHETRVLDLKPPPFEGPEIFLGSVTERVTVDAAIEGCDAVIHLAAAADVDAVEGDPGLAESVNVRGTLNVLEAARQAGVRRAVYASTTWVYSDCAQPAVDEDTVLPPPSHLYTATKLAGEMYCKAYRELYGLEFTILRFGIPYGPRARNGGVIAAFVRRTIAGEPLSIAGSGSQSRRFVFVEDLAEGTVCGLEPSAANRVFNLAGRESVSILKVAETVQEILGGAEIVHTPPRVGDFPGKEISTERAERELGWTASTPFADGVKRYVEWFRAHSRESEATPARAGEKAAVPTAQPKRVLILSADIGEGHDLPARALAADLEAECPGIEVTIEDCLAAMGRVVQFLVRDNSQVMFRRAPWLFGIQYFLLSRFAPTRWLSMQLTRLIGSRAILRLVAIYSPDAVVSTYPGSTALIGDLRRRRRLTVPTFSAITDLAGLYFWAHPGIDLHFVTHPESIEEVERIAGPGSVKWARPPHSPAFLVPRSTMAARKALGLPQDGKVVVVSGGGWGVGNIEGAIRGSLAVEGTTVVCLCGRNEDLEERLERRFAGQSRLRLMGFTDQMGDVLAAADALVHSTAGLTVLEAIIRGCPVVSFGFAAGHVSVNNRAFERFGLARAASSEADLTSTLRTLLADRPVPDRRFAARPSAASFVLANRPRVRPLPLWRLRLGRAVAMAATIVVLITATFASDDSYTIFANALDLHPTTTVPAAGKSIAVIVDAPQTMAPAIARRLAHRNVRASFALTRTTPSRTLGTLKRLGDEPMPKLKPGGPVRWLATRGQLKRTAAALGLSGHFFYATPAKGFTFGQYVLGHTDGATPVSATARFTAQGDPPSLQAGEIVELGPASNWSGWRLAMNALSRELQERGLGAGPVGSLARG